MSIKITASEEQEFRLRDCSGNDTILVALIEYLLGDILAALGIAVPGAVFIYVT